MIEENATVTAVQEHSITVKTTKQSGCGGCQQKSSCSTSVLDKYFGNKQIEMQLQTDSVLSVGDSVRVGIQESVFVRLTLLIYFLPLCALIIFGVIGQFLAEYLLLQGEAMAISFALAGFFSCFYLLKYLIKNKLNPKNLSPVLLNKA